MISETGEVNSTLEEEEVTLTATVTVGDAVFTRVFVVTVLPTPINAEAALAAEVGEELLVSGVVTALDPHVTGFHMQDENGYAIFVQTNVEVEVGNHVVVHGTRGEYTQHGNDQALLNSVELVYNDGESHDLVVETDYTLAEIVDNYPETSSQTFRVEDMEIDSYDAHSHVFFVTGADKDSKIGFDIRNVEGFTEENYPVGTVLPYVEFTVQRIHFDNTRIIVAEIGE